jgi:hypothetical protein
MADDGKMVLRVGDTVEYNDFFAGPKGEVIELVDDEHLRVRWFDMPSSTVHSMRVLRKL